MQRAAEASLIAAAEVGVATMKERLPPSYYTGGKYATGNLLLHIIRGEPFAIANGLAIQYGTAPMDPPYALFWELGHMAWPSYFSTKLNRWVSYDGPKKFRRKEIWVPTFYELRPQFQAAFERVYARFIGSQ
jgi:hypothetical protein